MITGQKPAVTRAKKSVANFKLREGMPIGCRVTLRGQTDVRFSRQADQREPAPDPGLSRAFRPGPSTAGATTTLGIREQLIFPEIDYDSIDKIRGMDITIVTTAEDGRGGLGAA